ncbi:Electron transport complex protein RnfB [Methanosarcina horonobensis HB-1 = JCM 15518]|uniref:Ion-translocating oxidoreductase complex subunit B n=1 Tax=Methanosarcina horonobensis HB-1 = JCM 15518 TaxID=1434110 RepID=A0A0E3SIV9_9EURY|nr:Fe-S cluster domain-containing protein [Methanosarcina horonobensis]AKB80038.1 Electron transport complex protein RnfB [Methanosarcina horonobensis HB-1 = JCM 15518]
MIVASEVMPVLINTVSVLVGLCIAVGAMLVIASKVFKVETNPMVDEVASLLPGANCGGCGFAGCAACAEAIVLKGAPINSCPVGGFDVAKLIGAVMGQEVSETEKSFPFVRCQGGNVNCTTLYDYEGVEGCKAALMLCDSRKGCTYGCLGLGTCVRACQFGALSMGENGFPVVNKALCTSCGNCIAACPNGVLTFAMDSEKVHVLCRSHDKGKDVKAVCEVGCIGCKKCEKECPQGAIKVTEFLAEIDQEKCTGCGACAGVCPQKAIELR